MRSFTYVILGGGMVAGYAAKEFVKRGLKPGELGILSAESVPPYERPPLSKRFLAGKQTEARLFITGAEFYRDHGIDLQLATPVTGIDVQNKRLRTQSGAEVGFERLLIATGARVRTLDLPGASLAGILYLRSLEDAKRIRAQAEGGKRAAVIGSGFIGMEVASVLAQAGLETTLIFPGERVWKRLFTPQMSAFFQRYYEQRGVVCMPRETVTAFEGNGRVSAVVTGSGRRLSADLVVAGIGAVPALEAVERSGLRLDNGVVVNEFLETSAPDIFAAGDVANYYDVLFAKQRRIEHWDNAVQQGKHAAGVLMGERQPFVHVPYFFSDVFDLSYEFWGDTAGADRVVSRGNLDSGRFSVWWLQAGRLTAAFVLNRPDEESALAPRWIAEQRKLTPERLQDDTQPLGQLPSD
jgi:3-phenylpropionate/trans-cinnamate dioxygenase ferredoxin reductase subunit